MPLSVEDFLENTNIADEQGSVVTKSKHYARFFQYNSKKYFLVPNQPLGMFKLTVNNITKKTALYYVTRWT